MEEYTTAKETETENGETETEQEGAVDRGEMV